MRLIEIVVGVILLGGAAWTTVRTYRAAALIDFSPRVRRIPRRPGFEFPLRCLWRVDPQLEVRERLAQMKARPNQI